MPRKWVPGDPNYGEYQTTLYGLPDDISDAEIDAATGIYWTFGDDVVAFGGDYYGDN